MIPLLILTFAVFVGFQMFARHRGTISAVVRLAAGRQRAASTPTDGVWEWGRGVWGLVLGASEKVLSEEIADSLLAVSWGITDRASFDAVLERMEPHAEKHTWRAVRRATLFRLGVVSGLIPAAEATESMTKIQARLRKQHDSWESVADAFEREHVDFLAEATTESGELERRQLGRFPQRSDIERSRKRLATEVWPELAFSED